MVYQEVMLELKSLTAMVLFCRRRGRADRSGASIGRGCTRRPGATLGEGGILAVGAREGAR
jgi:hypothetical protein